jgi:hypothetical protein
VVGGLRLSAWPIANKEPSLPKTLQQTLQVIGMPVFEPVPLVELFDAPTANDTPADELLLIPQLDSSRGEGGPAGSHLLFPRSLTPMNHHLARRPRLSPTQEGALTNSLPLDILRA